MRIMVENKIMYLKRRYADMRLGQAQIGVIVGIINFILITYNLSILKELIDFQWYVIIMANVFVLGLVFIGKIFRVTQLSTDHNMGFYQSPVERYRDRIFLENLHEIKTSLNILISPESKELLNLLKQLEKRK